MNAQPNEWMTMDELRREALTIVESIARSVAHDHKRGGVTGSGTWDTGPMIDRILDAYSVAELKGIIARLRQIQHMRQRRSNYKLLPDHERAGWARVATQSTLPTDLTAELNIFGGASVHDLAPFCCPYNGGHWDPCRDEAEPDSLWDDGYDLVEADMTDGIDHGWDEEKDDRDIRRLAEEFGFDRASSVDDGYDDSHVVDVREDSFTTAVRQFEQGDSNSLGHDRWYFVRMEIANQRSFGRNWRPCIDPDVVYRSGMTIPETEEYYGDRRRARTFTPAPPAEIIEIGEAEVDMTAMSGSARIVCAL